MHDFASAAAASRTGAHDGDCLRSPRAHLAAALLLDRRPPPPVSPSPKLAGRVVLIGARAASTQPALRLRAGATVALVGRRADALDEVLERLTRTHKVARACGAPSSTSPTVARSSGGPSSRHACGAACAGEQWPRSWRRRAAGRQQRRPLERTSTSRAFWSGARSRADARVGGGTSSPSARWRRTVGAARRLLRVEGGAGMRTPALGRPRRAATRCAACPSSRTCSTRRSLPAAHPAFSRGCSHCAAAAERAEWARPCSAQTGQERLLPYILRWRRSSSSCRRPPPPTRCSRRRRAASRCAASEGAARRSGRRWAPPSSVDPLVQRPLV